MIVKNIPAIIATFFCLHAFAQTNKMQMDTFVFDNEKDFTLSQADSLQQLLKNHYEKSGDEIVVVTTDSTGVNSALYADHFGGDHLLGDTNRINSMILLLSIKSKVFTMVPNKKLQAIITQEVLEKISKSGYTELKAHQFFEGVWNECKAVINFLENTEIKN
jgi:uncharacterized membrane protein YgcG